MRSGSADSTPSVIGRQRVILPPRRQRWARAPSGGRTRSSEGVDAAAPMRPSKGGQGHGDRAAEAGGPTGGEAAALGIWRLRPSVWESGVLQKGFARVCTGVVGQRGRDLRLYVRACVCVCVCALVQRGEITLPLWLQPQR